MPQVVLAAGGLGLAVLFLVAGLATFVFGSNYFRRFPTNANALYEGGLAAAFLAAGLLFRRSERLKPFWPVAYAFFVANMVWLLTTPAGGFGNWALRLVASPGTTPAGMAVAKVGETIGTVAASAANWKLICGTTCGYPAARPDNAGGVPREIGPAPTA